MIKKALIFFFFSSILQAQSFGIDINKIENAKSKKPFKKMLGKNGESVTINEVTFQLFSPSDLGSRDRGTSLFEKKDNTSLLRDFVYASPEEMTSKIIVRLTGLKSRVYEIKSYHYEPNLKYPAKVKVVLRSKNDKKIINSIVIDNSKEPATFTLSAKQNETYEIIVMPIKKNKKFRTRLNGVLITEK